MMETIKKVTEDKNFTAVNLGKLTELFKIASKETFLKEKVFLKEVTKATGSEISVSVLPAKMDFPFFHSHKQNEETYLILSGSGKFQVDDQSFDITEGSVIRVSPNGVRNLTNTSDEQMIYIVVQSKENSLEQYTQGDGVILEGTPLWR